MERVKSKLHSESGVSILLALLLLLVATMVSAVILSAAVTATKRVYDDKQQAQDYLTVSSAARLLRTAVTGASCTKIETTESETTNGTEIINPTVTTYESTGELGGLLLTAMLAADKDQEYTVQIVPATLDDGTVLDTAVFTFTMNPYDSDESVYYRIQGTVQLKDGGTTGQKVFFSAYAQEPSPTETDVVSFSSSVTHKTHTKETQWTWEGVVLTTIKS